MPISDYMRDLRAKVGNDLVMMPGAGGVVINDKNEVLLQLRSDTQTWCLLVGAMDPGEDVAECALREIYEEGGIRVIPERITSVLSGKDMIHTYPNGDQVAILSVTFRCRPADDTLPFVNDEESLDMRYFPADALPDEMMPRHRFQVETAIKNPTEALFRYEENLDVENLPDVTFITKIRKKVGHDLLMSPGATGIVINDQNEILLQLRKDKEIWGLPGGGMEPGEEPADAVVREVYEETGVIVQPERIIAVLAGEDHLVTYENGDQVAVLATVFKCRPIAGEPRVNDHESLDVRYFPLDNLPDNLLARHRFRIEIALKQHAGAFFRWDDA